MPSNNRNYTNDYQVIKFNEYLDEIDIKNPNLLGITGQSLAIF